MQPPLRHRNYINRRNTHSFLRARVGDLFTVVVAVSFNPDPISSSFSAN